MTDDTPPDDAVSRRPSTATNRLPLTRRRYLATLGAGTALSAGTTATGTAGAQSVDEGDGAYVDLDDGFADTSWLGNADVQVLTVEEPTRAALEEALTASGSRLVVFETSGTIDLGGEPLQITNDRCWVAGQTAPSPGITLIGGLFQVDANDCVVQHVRSRVGPGTSGDVQGNDSMNTQDGTTNVVFDHCTASWGVDECMSVGYDTDRTTFANCLITEPLWNPYGDETDHTYTTLIGDGADRVALLGNVWAKARSRVPRHKSGTRTVVANTVAYFFDEAANADDDAEISFVGNEYAGVTATGEPIVEGGTGYAADNLASDPPLDDDTPFADSLDASSPPLWPEGFEALPVADVEQHDLRYAGARPADRTENDQRIVEEIRSRAGNDRLDSEYDYWLGHHDEVGGYPQLPENAHELDVPDGGYRQWLEQWALAVEEPGAEPPGGTDDGPCADAAGGSTDVDGQVVCDVNDDGDYRDVTGDGSVGQGDVAAFFRTQHRSAWKQPDLFDFSENGAVTHGDVVELFDYVALH